MAAMPAPVPPPYWTDALRCEGRGETAQTKPAAVAAALGVYLAKICENEKTRQK
jgi:hypothetical protein